MAIERLSNKEPGSSGSHPEKHRRPGVHTIVSLQHQALYLTTETHRPITQPTHLLLQLGIHLGIPRQERKQRSRRYRRRIRSSGYDRRGRKQHVGLRISRPVGMFGVHKLVQHLLPGRHPVSTQYVDSITQRHRVLTSFLTSSPFKTALYLAATRLLVASTITSLPGWLVHLFHTFNARLPIQGGKVPATPPQ
jgi:hypothetical protein